MHGTTPAASAVSNSISPDTYRCGTPRSRADHAGCCMLCRKEISRTSCRSRVSPPRQLCHCVSSTVSKRFHKYTYVFRTQILMLFVLLLKQNWSLKAQIELLTTTSPHIIAGRSMYRRETSAPPPRYRHCWQSRDSATAPR